MSKRITIYLSDAAEKYFNLVMYGLEVPDGKGDTKPCNQSQAISHCLEELALFEEFTEDQLTNWLLTNYPDKYKAYRDALPANMKEPEFGKMAIVLPEVGLTGAPPLIKYWEKTKTPEGCIWEAVQNLKSGCIMFLSEEATPEGIYTTALNACKSMGLPIELADHYKP